MKLDRKTGEFIDIDTHVGDVSFEDANGSYLISVGTNGEFWRCIEIDGQDRCAGLSPKAARELAKLLVKAANVADAESKRLGWPPGVMR